MKKFIFTIFCSVAALCVSAASLDFSGTALPVITVSAATSTGLDAIYVVDNTRGVDVSYKASSPNATIYKFGNAGAAYAEPLTPRRNGNTITVGCEATDCGYVVEDGTRRYYFWVVNYANHALSLDALTVSPESDCSRAVLAASGKGAAINYYTINGQQKELSRELKMTWQTLAYSEEAGVFADSEGAAEFAHISSAMSVTAPLCNTTFTLTGDRFLREWGQTQSIESESYTAVAVDAHTSATQAENDADNMIKTDTESLGGSAPCEVTFHAEVTDAAVFREWQMSLTPDFADFTNRYSDLDLTYLFTDEGTTYVRFVCADASGECTYTSDTYTISVGASQLLIPNAFSPLNQDGINDIWKVSYASLVDFECTIFNRWGTKIISFTNPADGWDGRYKGKLVDPGVYFYVIKAVGADGVKYNKSGDINIVGSRKNNYTPAETE